jgi:putative hydrolase of the HAD superfamily
MESFRPPAASNNNSNVRAIFFDAGNTLVFLDRTKSLAPLASRGLTVAEPQIHAAERAARQYRDANASDHAHNPDLQYWHIYYHALLGDSADDALIDELVAAARNSQNWSVPLPNARKVLSDLKQKYRLAVISNSDGSISKLFEHLGLADLFESITDSGRVGVQKPYPEIFHAAMRSLNVPAEESVYIGDVYSIDYLGAKSAGMHAIIFDPYGTYANNAIPRITKLEDLENHLVKSEKGKVQRVK